MAKSYYENILAAELKKEGIPFEREFKFAVPERKWSADFYIKSLNTLIEVEGGIYAGGRHVRGKGYEGDIEKYNAASILGYTLLRFSSGQVEDGTAIKTIKSILGRESA